MFIIYVLFVFIIVLVIIIEMYFLVIYNIDIFFLNKIL